MIKQKDPNRDRVTPTNVCQLSSFMCENVKPGETVGLSGIPGVLELLATNGDAAEATIDFACGTNSTKGMLFDDRCKGIVVVIVRGNLVGRDGCRGRLRSPQMMMIYERRKGRREERRKDNGERKKAQQQREY